jgi:uncharacterized protein with von Willebrand factor type A (vWA) domain
VASRSFDVRATVRSSLRTGREPFELRVEARETSHAASCSLRDVSGSMSGRSRALLVLVHAILKAPLRTEAYCFGTRLTSETRALAVRSTAEALRRPAHDVPEWQGSARFA